MNLPTRSFPWKLAMFARTMSSPTTIFTRPLFYGMHLAIVFTIPFVFFSWENKGVMEGLRDGILCGLEGGNFPETSEPNILFLALDAS
jgi:hypothetical protein